MKKITWIIFFCLSNFLQAQTVIRGCLSDESNDPVPGVNIYLKGTYDGTSTNESGEFWFQTLEKGVQWLQFSAIGFDSEVSEVNLSGDTISLKIQLIEKRTELDAVVIAAGAFEASDENKAVIFRPLDIATTAGATADIYGALNTLPGTQIVGEEGKLFVRGGDSYETKTFIDGLPVHQPYSSSIPDLPARGRFLPFMFSGTVFSTGGYSAEYGQALSSALILNTKDMPESSMSEISLMTVGMGLSHTQKWDNTALAISGEYTNLTPYFAISKQQQFEWLRAPQGWGGSMIFRQKVNDDGLIKAYTYYDHTEFELNMYNLDHEEFMDKVVLMNNNFYLNAGYEDILSDRWTLKGGLSSTYNQDNASLNENSDLSSMKATAARIVFSNFPNDAVKIKFGGEYQIYKFEEILEDGLAGNQMTSKFRDHYNSLFTETDFYLGKKIVGRVGGRLEYSSVLDQFNVAPRLSMAWKTGKHSQASFAFGHFYQRPEDDFIKFNTSLDFEKAIHYILNYQLMKQGRTFRVEAYYKLYDNLLKFDEDDLYSPESYQNTGDGYARGIDVFWRDRKTLDNTDYWISYSYIDSRRDYRNYSEEAVPSFVSNHNLSIVFKYYLMKINTLVGLTYSFASGRPYENPNLDHFNESRTQSYHDLSANVSYLTTVKDHFTILYISLSNLAGFDNVFGYHYSSIPGDDGLFKEIPIKADRKRFFFMGLFINLEH